MSVPSCRLPTRADGKRFTAGDLSVGDKQIGAGAKRTRFLNLALNADVGPGLNYSVFNSRDDYTLGRRRGFGPVLFHLLVHRLVRGGFRDLQ